MNAIRKFLKGIFKARSVNADGSDLEGILKADQLLNRLVNENLVPGISISVLKNGTEILQKGYGFANIEIGDHVKPNETVFRVASVSKPISATALAHTVKEGLIDLDASFYKYVPYYPKKKYDFTMRQLASHTAGIRAYKGKEYGLNKSYSIKESIEIFKDDDLLFEPGTDYLYNSYDWILISLAIQEVTGIPFENYVQEKVLNALLMKNTLTHEKEDIQNLAGFYSKNKLGFRKAIEVNNYFKMAAGGFLSTSADIAKFGQAYLKGNVLNEEILKQFLTSEKVNNIKTFYGLGWQVSEDKKGRPYYGHVGNGVGGYSNFFVYPEQEMVFSILINCTNPNVQQELDTIIDILINETEEIG